MFFKEWQWNNKKMLQTFLKEIFFVKKRVEINFVFDFHDYYFCTSILDTLYYNHTVVVLTYNIARISKESHS